VRATGAAEDVALPPLPTGRHTLPWMQLHEHPPDATWPETVFRSATPWVVEFRDVLVHSDGGIICAGAEVVADTLGQAAPALHHYEATPDGIVLHPEGGVRHIRGTCLSLLTFGPDSAYHWTIDGIGRLAAADADAVAAATEVLVPRFRGQPQADLFARTGLARTHRVRVVGEAETIHVERLVVPWSIESDFTVGGNHRPHPSIRALFDRLAAAAPILPGPPRLYIDRSGSPKRPLVNEPDVMRALTPLGFMPVRLEDFSLAEQIGMFAHAEAIVGPHGAGLTNIVFARPRCGVVELHAGHWVNWCYRRLAGALDLDYDCVVGKVLTGESKDHVNMRAWGISVTHVVAAVEQMLARTA
jgi:capsular polysaccharide biosynthesis protein